MNQAVIKILQRVLINAFYKANAGFFLFCFFVLFGVVQPVIGYHLSLIQGMIQSFVFLGCVIGAWLLYTLKCINYIGKQLKEPRNDFLLVLNKLSPGTQYLLMLWVHMQIYLPVLLYAIVVAVMAGKQHFYAAMFAVIIANLVMIILSAILYRFYLQKKVLRVPALLPAIRINISKPLFSLPLWFIWNDRKQMLLLTKTFTLLLIYIFTTLYEPEAHDVRPLQLILLLVAMAHCAIVFQVRQFEEEYLVFSRSLPVTHIWRFTGLLGLYTILLLPELLFIWKACPAAFVSTDYPQLLLFTVSLLVFFHSILLMEDIDTDSYLRFVFAICAALFFVTLYNPGIILPVAVIILSFVFFRSHFYTFEKRHT